MPSDEYKGYRARLEDGIGKIDGIGDLVCFEDDFHEAVDDYLAFCKEVGKEPEYAENS